MSIHSRGSDLAVPPSVVHLIFPLATGGNVAPLLVCDADGELGHGTTVRRGSEHSDR